jgi:thioredoxin-related protein
MIKKLQVLIATTFVLTILVSTFAFTTKTTGSEGLVHWMTVEEAVKAQKTEARPIMIDVYTQWCGPCKMMSQKTFEDPRVAEYLNKNYYCVKFDAEGPSEVEFNGNTFKNPNYVPNTPGRNGVHEFTQYLQVSAYPTLVFLDKQAQYLGPITGFRSPAQLEIYLKFFAEDKQKVITTVEQWQEYEKNFVVTWN